MRIFEAQHNLPWVIEGAAVAVSIVCFAADGDSVRSQALLTAAMCGPFAVIFGTPIFHSI
jgi:hypothetical protein